MKMLETGLCRDDGDRMWPSVPFNDLFDHFFWNHTKGDRLYFSKGLSPERFCLLQIYMYSDRQSKSFKTTQR